MKTLALALALTSAAASVQARVRLRETVGERALRWLRPYDLTTSR